MQDSTKDTKEHINKVAEFINKINYELFLRANSHDLSKLKPPEKEIFDVYTPKLKNLTYGSEEYNDCLKKMNLALIHHYENNKHHPEHYKNGIKDMNLIDLIEMVCDWYAASLRHDNGSIDKSIEVNQKRFNYGNELKQLFLNTINFLKKGDKNG